ncbi:MAG: DUF1080 domain-containing protein [Armatimonadetes bacterium]|nr:DUF1080 domain-containing protein [Akkermansiaceae bacterium]
MKTLAPVLLTALLTTLPIFAEEKSTPLISGDDLSAWTFTSKDGPEAAEKSWTLKDGILSTTGIPIGVIRTKEEYENYTLTFEWRWLPGSEGGNSGLLLHSGKPGAGPNPPSIESQLQQNHAGDFYMIPVTVEATGKKDGGRWIRTADPKEKPLGEWNSMTVVCKADTITVHVNGTLVNEGKNLSATKGAICFQAEGTPIEFRNITLKQ